MLKLHNNNNNKVENTVRRIFVKNPLLTKFKRGNDGRVKILLLYIRNHLENSSYSVKKKITNIKTTTITTKLY
jgi:hypothetical protein